MPAQTRKFGPTAMENVDSQLKEYGHSKFPVQEQYSQNA